MKTQIVALLALIFLSFSCSKNNDSDTSDREIDSQPDGFYFPPKTTDTWETITTTELGWNTNTEQGLYDFLEERRTKAFILLKDGKIALEWYFDDHTEDTPWYWASAGKTLTAFTTGIAVEEGYLSLTERTSNYLGEGWTSTGTDKEDLITVWHQLTMTTGMDDSQGDCETPNCLTYVADAGTRWSYHNAPYTLIQDVVSDATLTDFEDYFSVKLKDKIGMTGQWISTNGSNNVYWSTARSMARFGLLNLNNGVWKDEIVLGEKNYLNAMKESSQALNKSYGYLWWLNGKESSMIPNSQIVFPSELMPDAPEDLYAGLGKNDQKLHIVPSQNLVLVRMGEDTGETLLGPSSFDNELWVQINLLIK